MKQWQIESKQLVLHKAEKPQAAKQEVLIRLEAIGINRADLLQVRGLYPAPAGYDNRVPGLEYVGTIEALGEGVLTRAVGERVMGLIPSGAYSEYICVHEAETLSLPSGISIEQAATIPEAFLTAYRALYVEAGLEAGEQCLIRPASSAVGLAAIQLAKARGAKVFGSSRDVGNLTAAKDAGLDYVVVENAQLAEQLECHSQGQGINVVLDMLGSQWQSLMNAMATEGRLVSIGIMAAQQAEINVFSLLSKRVSLKGLTMRSQPIEQRMLMAKAFDQHLLPLFEQQVLKPLPYQSFTFEQADQAHQHMQESAFSGKRVLVL